MEITELVSGIRKPVIIKEAESEDFKLLVRKRFSFTWKTFKNTTTVYKLQIEGENNILGVVGLIDWPGEKRLEIKLLASSAENIGKRKIYEGIAGCLIAFTCRMAISKYCLLMEKNLFSYLKNIPYEKEKNFSKVYFGGIGEFICFSCDA